MFAGSGSFIQSHSFICLQTCTHTYRHTHTNTHMPYYSAVPVICSTVARREQKVDVVTKTCDGYSLRNTLRLCSLLKIPGNYNNSNVQYEMRYEMWKQ